MSGVGIHDKSPITPIVILMGVGYRFYSNIFHQLYFDGSLSLTIEMGLESNHCTNIGGITYRMLEQIVCYTVS